MKKLLIILSALGLFMSSTQAEEKNEKFLVVFHKTELKQEDGFIYRIYRVCKNTKDHELCDKCVLYRFKTDEKFLRNYEPELMRYLKEIETRRLIDPVIVEPTTKVSP